MLLRYTEFLAESVQFPVTVRVPGRFEVVLSADDEVALAEGAVTNTARRR